MKARLDGEYRALSREELGWLFVCEHTSSGRVSLNGRDWCQAPAEWKLVTDAGRERESGYFMFLCEAHYHPVEDDYNK